MLDVNRVTAEISDLHAFLEKWFNGVLPKSREAFSRLSTAWPPNFTLIDPHNQRHSARSILEQTYDQHGQFRGLSIQIKNVRVGWASGEVVVATYEEWHVDSEQTEARLCSATLVPAPAGTTASMLWIHVHESMLDQSFPG